MDYSSPREAVKVSGLAWILGTLSGLRFVAPDLPAEVTIVTAIAVIVQALALPHVPDPIAIAVDVSEGDAPSADNPAP